MAYSNSIGKLSLSTALATLIAVSTSSAAHALVIDFEDNSIAQNTNEDVFSSITSQEFLFEPTLTFEQTQYALANDVFEAYNGSTYFVIRNLVSDDTLDPLINPLKMSPVDGTPFSLVSLDLAEWGEIQDQAKQVEVIGFLTGGGSITRLIEFDGDSDGSGSLADFETVTFDNQWGNLIGVQFKGINAPASDNSNEQPGFQVNSFAIDNIKIGDAFKEPPVEVPEPSSMLGILAIAGMSFGSILRGKRTQC